MNVLPAPTVFILFDAQTPQDGGVWYIGWLADATDVWFAGAQNTETLFKLQIELGAINYM